MKQVCNPTPFPPPCKAMSEFTRQLKLGDILTLQSRQEIRRSISAQPDECAALAKRFGLVAVNGLNAEVVIHPWNNSGVRVSGTINAYVIQRCVVSLKPVEQKVCESFTSFFEQPNTRHEEADIDTPVHVEDPEDITPEGIDIGELVAQQLSLVLDPYPHIPGAVLPEPINTTMPMPRKSPFAILQKQ